MLRHVVELFFMLLCGRIGKRIGDILFQWQGTTMQRGHDLIHTALVETSIATLRRPIHVFFICLHGLEQGIIARAARRRRRFGLGLGRCSNRIMFGGGFLDNRLGQTLLLPHGVIGCGLVECGSTKSPAIRRQKTIFE
jgi:hypothetical protein